MRFYGGFSFYLLQSAKNELQYEIIQLPQYVVPDHLTKIRVYGKLSKGSGLKF